MRLTFDVRKGLQHNRSWRRNKEYTRRPRSKMPEHRDADIWHQNPERRRLNSENCHRGQEREGYHPERRLQVQQ